MDNRTPRRFLRIATVAIALVGCGDDGAATGSTPCDPLATKPAQPTELKEILGVGRAEDGTLYVVDRGDSEFDRRAFISDAKGTLVRHRIVGTGDGTTEQGARWSMLSVELGDADSITLALEMRGDTLQMATAPPASTKAQSIDALENRQDLEVLDADSVADTPAREFAYEVEIEYIAEAETGELMLVIRPRDGWDYEDFRVFYGKPPELAERSVDSVVRALDGGSTTIEFDLDSQIAVAHFPVMSTPDGFAWGPASLELGSKTIALERREPKRSELDDAELLCAQ